MQETDGPGLGATVSKVSVGEFVVVLMVDDVGDAVLGRRLGRGVDGRTRGTLVLSSSSNHSAMDAVNSSL